MKNLLFICFIILLVGCSNAPHKQNNMPTKILSLLTIREQKLYPILDSVVNFEKKCDYFQDSIYFSVSIYSDEINFESGIDVGKTLSLKTIGYFVYKNHLFFVHRLDENWVSTTKEQKIFTYKEQDMGMIDDSWTSIRYSYIDGNFKLTGRTSSCGDDVPFENIK